MQRKIESFVLRSFGGRIFGYAADPGLRRAPAELVQVVQGAAKGLVVLDEHMAAGNTEAAHIALQILLRKARETTQSEAAQLAKDRQAFYATPEVADLALDAELRAYVRGLQGDARDRLLEEVRRGERPEILHALARFPAPMPEAEMARQVYSAQREVADPEGADGLRERDAALEWATTTANAIEAVVNDATVAGKLPASVLL